MPDANPRDMETDGNRWRSMEYVLSNSAPLVAPAAPAFMLLQGPELLSGSRCQKAGAKMFGSNIH